MSGTEPIRGQGPNSDVVEVKAPISNTSFFARRPLKSSPKVQLRSAPGSKNKALTPLSELGFTYLGVMIIVMVMGMGLAAFGTIYSQSAQRDKEAELLFVGEQFRQAIALYYWRTPGGAHQYPKSLEALLEDSRWPVTQRWLRKIYRDPLTNTAEWGVVEAPGNAGIMGVYSKSEGVPIKSAGFPARYSAFEEAKSYQDWKFVFSPEVPKAPPAQAAAAR